MLHMLAASANSGPSPHEPRYHPLVIVLVAVVAGIIVDRSWPLPLCAWSTIATGGLGLWLLVAAFLRSRQNSASDDEASKIEASAESTRFPVWLPVALVANVALLLAVAATAAAWHHCRWNLYFCDDIGCYAHLASQPIAVNVIALGPPRRAPSSAPDPMQSIPSGEYSRLDVDVIALRNGSQWQAASGRATLIVLGEPPAIEAGDRLRCFVRLSAPARPQNPGTLDRSAYLRAERIRGRLVAEVPQCLTLVDSGSPWSLTRLVGSLRLRGDQVLKQCLEPRQAQLAAAVLLGLREELDTERTQAFLTTGTVHILSISGLHVGILAGAMFWLMRRTPLPRGWAVATIAVVTLLYALMVDARPPVIRATVLVLVACGALYLGRRTLGMNTLAAAALVVLALNPAHLFNVGAQLSFLCVAGLIWYAGRRPHSDDRAKKTLDRLVMANLGWLSRARHRIWRALVGLLLAGAVLWSLCLPLVMARFHILSPVALILNALLWVPVSLSMLSGFGTLLFGAIWSPLGSLCGWLCNVSFWILEDSINFADRCPCSHFWVPGPADWWLWGFYGGIGLLTALPRLRPPRRWCASLLAVWIAVGLAASAWPSRHDHLDCTFLSMGHGCAALLELPSGQTMLYDAGQMGSPWVGARSVSEFLWDRGKMHIDAVVLSHPDIDHYNALPGLLDKFSVGTVYVSPQMFEKDNGAVAALRCAIDEHAVPVREVQAGDRIWAADGCTIEVLHPPRQSIFGSENANSLVLSVDYLDREILLTGDVESTGLNKLLSEKPRHASVLLAPHHGSRKSNSPELAHWCTPEYVVFSGDGRWSIAETEATYRAVGGTVFHTYSGGAIHVQIDAAGVRVSQFIDPR